MFTCTNLHSDCARVQLECKCTAFVCWRHSIIPSLPPPSSSDIYSVQYTSIVRFYCAIKPLAQQQRSVVILPTCSGPITVGGSAEPAFLALQKILILLRSYISYNNVLSIFEGVRIVTPLRAGAARPQYAHTFTPTIPFNCLWVRMLRRSSSAAIQRHYCLSLFSDLY